MNITRMHSPLAFRADTNNIPTKKLLGQPVDFANGFRDAYTEREQEFMGEKSLSILKVGEPQTIWHFKSGDEIVTETEKGLNFYREAVLKGSSGKEYSKLYGSPIHTGYLETID